jgi:hypothetical protein
MGNEKKARLSGALSSVGARCSHHVVCEALVGNGSVQGASIAVLQAAQPCTSDMNPLL